VPKVVDSAARVVATAFGSGYSPLAPGTAGSAVGLLLFWPMAALAWPWQAAASAVLFVVGSLAAGRVARRAGLKDPGIVVVDEVVGQWVTLTALPFTPLTAALGFLLFRAMDIVKPWPARDLERVPGGWGIMADDVAAGVYAHLLLRVFLAVWPVG
jgi:phosphatidylglycerophosphatase A